MNRFLSCGLAAAFFCFCFCTVVSGVEYRFVKIVEESTPAPIGLFNDFGLPAISGDVVAFRASFGDYETGESGSGIFTGSGHSLQTIVKQGDTAPSGVFHHFSNDPTISGSLVAFRTSYGDTFTSGVFVGSGGAPTLIASPGDTTPRGTLNNELGDPSISNGTVAVRNGYMGDRKGIVSGSGGPLTPIVATGDPAPIGTFGFNHVGHPAISDGNVAFLGGGGISVGNGGPLTTIAKLGNPAPVGTFTTLSEPSIDGNVVAFSASYSDGNGIFTGTGGALTTIIKRGDPAPNGTFQGMSNPSISGNEIAFIGSYINTTVRGGIFVYSGGSVTSVIENENTLFGESVTSLDFSRFGFDPGGSGRLAFRYSLESGQRGIAVAIPVPEPNGMALCCIGALLVVFKERRSRGTW